MDPIVERRIEYEIFDENTFPDYLALAISIKDLFDNKHHEDYVVVGFLDGEEHPLLVRQLTGVDPDYVDSHASMPMEWRNFVDSVCSSGVIVIRLEKLQDVHEFIEECDELVFAVAHRGKKVEIDL